MLQNEPEALCEFALMCKARIAQDKGDVKTAVNALTTALKYNPKSPRYYF